MMFRTLIIFWAMFVVGQLVFAEDKKEIKVLPEDQICEKNSDCILIETNCNIVTCGPGNISINKKYKDKYQQFLQECTVFHLKCDADRGYAMGTAECKEQKCVIEDVFPEGL